MRGRATKFPILLALSDAVALVVLLLAFCHANFHLRPAVLEIDRQRNQRRSFNRERTFKLADLTLVRQKLSLAVGNVVVDHCCFVVGVDVALIHHQFAAIDAGEGFLQIGFAIAQGFNLGPDENNSTLDLCFDVIIVQGPAVVDAGVEVGFAF